MQSSTGWWGQDDHRHDDWITMKSPWLTLSICLGYIFVVKYAGPKFMANRKAFELRELMIVYNMLMVVVSFVLFYKFGVHGWFGKYDIRCQPVDYSNSENALAMLHTSWLYYMSKFVEFFDTIFFVLRKKDSHVSVLHVIHHSVMPMSVWIGVKYAGGGHLTFFALLNTLIHVIMYFYYGLAAIGPSMAKYLWWKKYITTLQMIQFVCIFIHASQMFFRPECNIPRGLVFITGCHAIFFLVLFIQFYIQEYTRKARGINNNKTKKAKFDTTSSSNTDTTSQLIETTKNQSNKNDNDQDSDNHLTSRASSHVKEAKNDKLKNSCIKSKTNHDHNE